MERCVGEERRIARGAKTAATLETQVVYLRTAAGAGEMNFILQLTHGAVASSTRLSEGARAASHLRFNSI